MKQETLEQAGVVLLQVRGERPNREIVVMEEGSQRLELYAEKADCPSSCLLHDGTKWEFVRSGDDLAFVD